MTRRSFTVEELRLSVARAFGTLTFEHQEVIRLAHHEHLTIRQIACRSGLPVETVQRRATAALGGLNAALTHEAERRGG